MTHTHHGSEPNPSRHAGVAAILVVYDLACGGSAALRWLSQHVAHVVLVDNSAGGHPLAREWQSDARVHVIANANRGGLAGAYNAAVTFLRAHRADVTHLVFVDDDSDPSVLDALLRDAPLRRLLEASSTAAVAPAHRDRATGMRARHMRLARWTVHFLDREVRGVQPVAFIINSMSVWRLQAVVAIGPFDEAMAVDHIDTDYCLRAQRHGLSVYLAADHEFSHAIGARRAYRMFGRTMQSGGHGPARRRSIGRNTARLGLRYAAYSPAFAALCMARLCHESVGIALAEDRKLTKLMALWRGVAEGLFTRR
jgi:rhamnosyltransferase